MFRLVHALLPALVTTLLAATVPLSASAHGGLSMDEDYCKLRVGRYVMHFVGYQPDSPAGPREFCEDIPDIGRTVVVLDYIDAELRDLPTEVRVIRDAGDDADMEQRTVLHLPPRLYPSGSLNFEIEFNEPGKFIGLVSVGDRDKLVSRFPFSVGRRSRWLYIIIPGVLALAGGMALYRFGLRRRSKAGA
jgi:hypothetical protein